MIEIEVSNEELRGIGIFTVELANEVGHAVEGGGYDTCNFHLLQALLSVVDSPLLPENASPAQAEAYLKGAEDMLTLVFRRADPALALLETEGDDESEFLDDEDEIVDEEEDDEVEVVRPAAPSYAKRVVAGAIGVGFLVGILFPLVLS